MERECRHCKLPIAKDFRSDKIFCDDKCRNNYHNAIKGTRISRMKVAGMLILLNKIYWKIPADLCGELLTETNDIPMLWGKFYFSKSNQAVMFKRKK